MECPYCNKDDDRVVDTRPIKEGRVIRRRRKCNNCEERFTTYEYIQNVELYVIKRDGRREPFDRGKLREGISLACRKRPVSVDTIESIVDQIEEWFMDRASREVESSLIGEEVMEHLRQLDDVSYVRFASVYKKFKDVSEFNQALEEINDPGETNED